MSVNKVKHCLFYLFIFLLSQSIPLFSQSTMYDKIDSIYLKLNSAGENEKVKLYYDLAILLRDTDPQKGIGIAEAGLALAKKLNDKEGEANMLIAFGGMYSAMSYYNLAYPKYLKALEISHEIQNVKIEGSATNSMGLYYYWQGMYEKALEYFTQAANIRAKLPDLLTYANTLNNIGLVQYQVKNYGSALEYYKKALKIKETTKDVASCVRTMSNIALIYDVTGKSNEAFDILAKALEKSKKIDYKGGIALILGSYGTVYATLNDYRKALEYYEKALELYKSMGGQYSVAEINYSISGLYLKMNDLEQAIKYSLLSLNISEAINSSNHKIEIFKNLSDIYRKKGDLSIALLYKDSLLIAKDSALNYEKNTAITENLTLNQMATKDIELNAKQSLIRDQNIMLIITVTALSVFIVLTFFVYFMYKKKKKIAGELILTKTLLETSFFQTPIPMLLISLPDKVIQYCNIAAKEIFGVPADTVTTGLKLSNLNAKWQILDSNKNLIEKENTPINRSIKGEIIKEMEFIVKRADGTHKHCLVSAVPVFKKNGDQIAVFEVFPDITPLKEIENQLIQNRKELIELNATKDKFFSIVAHDLKSPFHGFIGISQIIAGDTTAIPAERIKKLSQSLHKALKIQYQFLEDLLQWSRIQADRMEFNPVVFNLHEAVKNTINIVYNNSEGKLITIENRVSPNLNITADKEMLHLILRNLISNSIKFSYPGASVFIRAKEESGWYEVSVEDTGIGIKEENIEKLFRLDVHYTTIGTGDEQGTGLGLILCKELVEKHGGSIRVESEVDKGSKFIFTISKKINQ